MKLLVVGLNHGMIQALERVAPSHDHDLWLIEEPSVLSAHPDEYKYRTIAGVRAARYVFAEEAIGEALAWQDEVGFDAVLPGREYAVAVCQRIADALGLAGPGGLAASVCTDKLTLRIKASKLGMATPRFAPVVTVEDLRAQWNGTPLILKPRNRHGSLGVIRIFESSEVESAWADCVTAPEGTHAPTDRALSFSYLCEEILHGREYSVESLVQHGRILFSNITEKTITEPPFCAEVMHLLPAQDGGSQRNTRLVEATSEFLMGIEACDGLFHSEWMVVDGKPWIIECAARTPGDRIPRLIELAYGFNIVESWARICAGIDVQPPPDATASAATVFFAATPGVVTDIRGTEFLATTPEVTEFSLPKPGEILGPIKDSHSRPGFAVVVCSTPEAVRNLVTRLHHEVVIATTSRP